MLGALWAYDGWNNLTLVAGEVKNPQRNIPIALIGGMAVVASLYIFANVAYFYVLTPTEVASVPADGGGDRSGGPLSRRVRGESDGGGASRLAFGTLHTSILTGARVPTRCRATVCSSKISRASPARARVPVGALIVRGFGRASSRSPLLR